MTKVEAQFLEHDAKVAADWDQHNKDVLAHWDRVIAAGKEMLQEITTTADQAAVDSAALQAQQQQTAWFLEAARITQQLEH